MVVADNVVDGVSQALTVHLGGDRAENIAEWHPVFRRENGQRFNDHVFAVSSDGWKTSVITRDVLRTFPDLRREYKQLKWELIGEHDDLVIYSTGKTTFIKQVLDIARTDDHLRFDFTLPTVSEIED
nr:GrpB family protein [Haladaptatus salinisoli]